MTTKILFALTDVAFLAAGYCWMAHGNEFAGNIFRFVAWASFALGLLSTVMRTPWKSDPFSHTWRAWAAGFAIVKILMTAGFGQFLLATVMSIDSLLLWSRVREWDRRAVAGKA